MQSGDGEKRSRAYAMQLADDAAQKIRVRRPNSDNVGTVKIMNGVHADGPEPLEQDFTTRGTPGRLGCPYVPGKLASSANGHRGASTPRSSMSRGSFSGRRSKRPSFHDPIRADICGQPVSADVSVDGSVPLCPIRFLDQHSPEELAKYFESHKHELPRSHEVCIKRFQENQDAIQQLDSKYANVVNMVTELSKVHKPMLPEPDEIAIEDNDSTHDAADKVQNWALDVSSTVGTHALSPQDDEPGRESRFDRPLKDIRLGESPSRPWGIPVPDQYHGVGESTSPKSDHTASPLDPAVESPERPDANATAKRCPFGEMMGADAIPPHPILQTGMPVPTPFMAARDPDRQSDAAPGAPAAPASDEARAASQIVFNGPVFIGYPADQALAFFKQIGTLPSKQ
jgi:hypothetical protein